MDNSEVNAARKRKRPCMDGPEQQHSGSNIHMLSREGYNYQLPPYPQLYSQQKGSQSYGHGHDRVIYNQSIRSYGPLPMRMTLFHDYIQVPVEKVRLFIGTRGGTINFFEQKYGVSIELTREYRHNDYHPIPLDKTFKLTGDNREKIETARKEIFAFLDQTMWPSTHSGGYNQVQQSSYPHGSIASTLAPHQPFHTQFSGSYYELLRRYGDDPCANPFEILALTRQTGSVDEYVEQFIARIAFVKEVPAAHALGLFLHGLRDDIRLRIRSKDAKDICQTIHLAREIEQEISALRVPRLSGNSSWAQAAPPHTNHSTPSPLPPKPGESTQFSRSPTPQRGFSGGTTTRTPSESIGSINQGRPTGPNYMLHTEYMDLRNKGLCFKCKEPYSPHHVCANKSLRVMFLGDEEGEGEPAWETGEEAPNNGGGSELRYLEVSGVPP